SDMDTKWPKIFTVISLTIGMSVAIGVQLMGSAPVTLIIFAQSLTVLGNPALAGILFWLAMKPNKDGGSPAPLWMRIVAAVGFILVLYLAIRSGIVLYYKIFV